MRTFLAVRVFSPKTSSLLDGLRFAVLETANNVDIDLLEDKTGYT